MKVRFWNMMTFLWPQIGPEPNFDLGPEPNFQTWSFLSKVAFGNLHETTIKICFQRIHLKMAKQANQKNTNFWHFWKGVVKHWFVATPTKHVFKNNKHEAKTRQTKNEFQNGEVWGRDLERNKLNTQKQASKKQRKKEILRKKKGKKEKEGGDDK